MVLCLTVFPDGPKSTVCFVCQKLGRLLNCLYCPRSYHPECLDPTRSGVTLSEGWTCPACSILHGYEPTAPIITGQVPHPPERSNPQSSGGDGPFIEARESTILLDSSRPEEMRESNTRKESPQASSTQPTYSSGQKSSNPRTRSNLQDPMSNENATPNKPMRSTFSGPSSVEPRIFIHAHSAMPHHHNAFSKFG
jgi:hypothetical protein